MKRSIIRFLQGLVSNKSVFLKIKDTVFCNNAEHLYRVTDYAQKKHPQQLNLPILDVGAANGDTTDYFAKNFPGAPIIGFEPIDKMFRLATEKNTRHKNVTIKNLALYDSIGKHEINITANYVSSSLNTLNSAEINKQAASQHEEFKLIEKQSVALSTLDEETKSFEKILLIKLDTQGTELKILEGGIETLHKTHLILVELSNHDLYHHGCQYHEVDQFLRDHHFKMVDMIVAYRPEGVAQEYDAIYENTRLTESSGTSKK